MLFVLVRLACVCVVRVRGWHVLLVLLVVVTLLARLAMLIWAALRVQLVSLGRVVCGPWW